MFALSVIGNVILIVIGILGIYLCIKTLILLFYHRSDYRKYSKSNITSNNNPSDDIQNIKQGFNRSLPNSHFNISKNKK